ncbi:hypothetical protein [Streptomyces pseudovenezuelae]|uniref:DUF4034 domain-containing protein n=1 Tax=Streptomyces pseudovenezuelae TaxID=67350 RepID=A0ABT6M0X0_9ACTN|nr:hypothetical protein [Streptomyces pseudovenezuelae]MDH6222211.1 hypothetical protein [Streptomyces pseudovenezuelae]
MSGTVQARFHPAGFDDELRTVLDDVRAGRWRSMSELLRRCPTWGIRTSRSQVLAVAAAQGDAVEAWLQEDRDANAVMMRARVMTQRALTAHRAGRRDGGVLADLAWKACLEAARNWPVDPVPWVCLVALAQLDSPEVSRRRPEHRLPAPEYNLPPGPWGFLHEADQRDRGNREAWHRMIQALKAYGDDVHDVARWICTWAPAGSPLLLLPLYLHAEHYGKQRASGSQTSLYWNTDPIAYYTKRALSRWFRYADPAAWSPLDLNYLAQALFSGGLTTEATPVFQVIGPFATPEPWTYMAEAPERWLEQFERARRRCLQGAAARPPHPARRR